MDSSGTLQENPPTQPPARANYWPGSVDQPAFSRANYIPGPLTEEEKKRQVVKAERRAINERLKKMADAKEAARQKEVYDRAEQLRKEQQTQYVFDAKISEVRSIQQRIEELDNALTTTPHHLDEKEHLRKRQDWLLQDLNITLRAALSDSPKPSATQGPPVPTTAPVSTAAASPKKKPSQE